MDGKVDSMPCERLLAGVEPCSAPYARVHAPASISTATNDGLLFERSLPCREALHHHTTRAHQPSRSRTSIPPVAHMPLSGFTEARDTTQLLEGFASTKHASAFVRSCAHGPLCINSTMQFACYAYVYVSKHPRIRVLMCSYMSPTETSAKKLVHSRTHMEAESQKTMGPGTRRSVIGYGLHTQPAGRRPQALVTARSQASI